MKTDAIRERYDAVPYRHGAVPDSHPARIGAIARLFGIQAAAPDRCRVLELGCGEGMNLLPLAERFPGSEFVGVDFSESQIAVAEAARSACGIENARFACADFRTWKHDGGTFDYVIAHGVYSWVPAEVRERLLAICAKVLSPNGVAYVGYNTLPGWGLPGAVRQFLLSETSRHEAPTSQLTHAGRVLEAVAEAMKEQPGSYAANLRDTIADMRQKASGLLFHDELAAINEPCTFVDFIDYATRHDLHYLAEAHYATMQFQHVPDAMRAALAPLKLDFIRTQQFLDVLFQRWLRNSLLCLTPLAESRPVRTGVIADCALALRMTVDANAIDLAPGQPMRFTGFDGLVLESRDSAEKALLTVLASSYPTRLPFPAVCAMMNQALVESGLPNRGDFSAMHDFLHRLFALDVLDAMLCGDGRWLTTSAKPGPSDLMRYQAAHDLPLTSRWHESVGLTADGRQALVDPVNRPDDAALLRAGLLV